MLLMCRSIQYIVYTTLFSHTMQFIHSKTSILNPWVWDVSKNLFATLHLIVYNFPEIVFGKLPFPHVIFEALEKHIMQKHCVALKLAWLWLGSWLDQCSICYLVVPYTWLVERSYTTLLLSERRGLRIETLINGWLPQCYLEERWVFISLCRLPWSECYLHVKCTPVSLMKEILAHLVKGRIFTKLDLREAYYCIRIWEGDEWKTASNCFNSE